MKLKREIKKYIESELRDYKTTKKELEQARSDIIYAGCSGDDSGIRGTDIGNATQSKALKLLTNRRLAQLERTIKAFERVIGSLPEDKFKLVQMRYWDNQKTKILTDDGIALKLYIDRKTVYNWANGIILALAIELGLVD